MRIYPWPAPRTTSQMRAAALEYGLKAHKVRGREEWTVEHPDGRHSTPVPHDQLAVLFMQPSDVPLVIGGQDFTSRHVGCMYRRTPAQVWADLVAEHQPDPGSGVA